MPPEDLADQLVAMAIGLRELGLEPARVLARDTGLPVGEVVASPFSLRAVAMAHAVGARALPHELRWHVPWADPADEDESGLGSVADDGHGTWSRGVLHVGKYQGFCQDDPLSTYNPNHMSKWGPHELLHRVCKFFWRTDMTRWELYLGARLNELVPVVAWYGPDEVMRLDRDGFDRERDQAAPHAEPSRATWLRDEVDALHDRAKRTARYLVEGLAHFEREFAAIAVEIETGARVSVPHPILDSSSDAIAYVVGHWDRLTSEPYRAFMAGRSERDYVSDIRSYRAWIEGVLDALLFEPLPVDSETTAETRAQRLAWDVDARQAKLAFAETRGVHFAGGVKDRALALGASGDPKNPIGLEQLLEGLESIVPATLALLASDAIDHDEAWLDAFASSPYLSTRGNLGSRFESFVHRAGLGDAVAELLRLERLIAAAERSDSRVEQLGVAPNPHPPEDGFVVASTAFGLHRFRYDVAALHAAALGREDTRSAFEERASAYLIGLFDGAVSLLPATEGVATLWSVLARGPIPVAEALALLEIDVGESEALPATADEWFGELLAAGALGWAPAL